MEFLLKSGHTAVREAGGSRQHGNTIEALLKPLGNIRDNMGTKGFMGPQLGPHYAEKGSLDGMQKVPVVFLVCIFMQLTPHIFFLDIS